MNRNTDGTGHWIRELDTRVPDNTNDSCHLHEIPDPAAGVGKFEPVMFSVFPPNRDTSGGAMSTKSGPVDSLRSTNRKIRASGIKRSPKPMEVQL